MAVGGGGAQGYGSAWITSRGGGVGRSQADDGDQLWRLRKRTASGPWGRNALAVAPLNQVTKGSFPALYRPRRNPRTCSMRAPLMENPRPPPGAISHRPCVSQVRVDPQVQAPFQEVSEKHLEELLPARGIPYPEHMSALMEHTGVGITPPSEWIAEGSSGGLLPRFPGLLRRVTGWRPPGADHRRQVTLRNVMADSRGAPHAGSK